MLQRILRGEKKRKKRRIYHAFCFTEERSGKHNFLLQRDNAEGGGGGKEKRFEKIVALEAIFLSYRGLP